MNEPKAAQYFDSESKAQLVNETRRQHRENVEHCRAERARGVLPSECLREGFEAIRENAYLRMKKADKDLKVKEESKAAVESSKQHSVDRENKVGEYGKQFNKSWGDNSGAGPDAEAVVLGGRDSKANIVKPTGETPTVPTSRRGPTRKLIAHKPPVLEISEDLQGMKDYAQINKENKFTGAMAEVDKDGASGGTVNAAKAAGLKTIFQISKDFDETFLNNPSPKDEDVRMVIDKIKSKAKNPDDAWEIAKLMRDKRDFPALRDAEHYLWSCSRTTGSKWDGAATLVVTPLYSMAKLPGLRKIFFDDATSPPSVSEMKWGAKGVKDCWK